MSSEGSMNSEERRKTEEAILSNEILTSEDTLNLNTRDLLNVTQHLAHAANVSSSAADLQRASNNLKAQIADLEEETVDIRQNIDTAVKKSLREHISSQKETIDDEYQDGEDNQTIRDDSDSRSDTSIRNDDDCGNPDDDKSKEDEDPNAENIADNDDDISENFDASKSSKDDLTKYGLSCHITKKGKIAMRSDPKNTDYELYENDKILKLLDGQRLIMKKLLENIKRIDALEKTMSSFITTQSITNGSLTHGMSSVISSMGELSSIIKSTHLESIELVGTNYTEEITSKNVEKINSLYKKHEEHLKRKYPSKFLNEHPQLLSLCLDDRSTAENILKTYPDLGVLLPGLKKEKTGMDVLARLFSESDSVTTSLNTAYNKSVEIPSGKLCERESEKNKKGNNLSARTSRFVEGSKPSKTNKKPSAFDFAKREEK